MKFKKFIAASTLTVALASISIVPAFAEESVNTEKNDLIYDNNKNLTSEEIHNRFDQINSTYELNESFSMEDAEFIENYAYNVVDQSSQLGERTRGVGMFKSSHTEKFNRFPTAQIQFTGSITSNINLLNHSYGGNVVVNFKKGHDAAKADVSISNVAYGLIGNNGIGIVYDDKIERSKTKDFSKSFSVDEMVDYGGIAVVYTYTNAKVTITTADGSTYSKRALD